MQRSEPGFPPGSAEPDRQPETATAPAATVSERGAGERGAGDQGGSGQTTLEAAAPFVGEVRVSEARAVPPMASPEPILPAPRSEPAPPAVPRSLQPESGAPLAAISEIRPSPPPRGAAFEPLRQPQQTAAPPATMRGDPGSSVPPPPSRPSLPPRFEGVRPGDARALPPPPELPPPPRTSPEVPSGTPRWRTSLRRAFRIAAYAVAGYLAIVALLVVLFRWVDPPMSALMLIRAASGQKITQSWVPLASVSPNLMRAVVVSEDARFCTHHGIDIGEIKAAIERAKDGIPRGASTISMQLAKNMFLWPSKSYVRKAIELPLTLYIEAIWPKWRIFEVYINIAEWGPGIFGAEAAARHHFDKPASRLYEYESALLAVSLPNPFDRDPGDPAPLQERLASRVEARMRAMTRATQCLEAHVKAPKPGQTRGGAGR